jgi:hypothetical protein
MKTGDDVHAKMFFCPIWFAIEVKTVVMNTMSVAVLRSVHDGAP